MPPQVAPVDSTVQTNTAGWLVGRGVSAGSGVAEMAAWTEADQALWSGVLNFWFVGRVFDRARS
ncbi:MAG: hypothetical protein COW02_05450 [Comamonadaceae bacterium CG12_big_fil_rev_8_21_14_0_65_59_15]|nr:MAG: hypothetical protein COW02_05450 [Comamonadaceae bacterium CG12_big_fil_rev_8_21_14_0_65_59_15]